MSQEHIGNSEENGGWFSKLVPSLIAIVTLVGALVAWRASVAGNMASNLDSKGLLAVQNYEAIDTQGFITANQHRAAHVQYMRFREYAESLAKYVPPEDATPEEIAALDRLMREGFDLAATSKYYFFPGRYLNQDGDYEFQLERDEVFAAAAQKYDMNYDTSFAESDRLGDKMLALLLMLLVLGVSLWYLALAEALENPAKYTLALGGLIFLVLGGIGAFLIDTEASASKATADLVVLVSWILAIVTTIVSIVIAIVAVSRRKGRAQAVVAPMQPMQPSSTVAPPGSPYYAPMPQGAPYPGPGAPMQGQVAPVTPYQQYQPYQQLSIPQPAPRKRISWDDRLKPFITIMIATVALTAVIITYLQTEASSNAGLANRNTQQYSLQGLGWGMYGEAARSYHFGDVALTWQQLEMLARYADDAGDTETAERYRAVRDGIAITSPLYTEPYFTEGSTALPDADSYVADNFTGTAIEYQEYASSQSQVNNAWDAKAGSYIAMLTFLAVSLALFGLALTVSGFIRLLFVVVGLILFANTLVLSVSTYTSPVPSLSNEAISSYATGYAMSYSFRYEEAIPFYDEALAVEPNYGNALAGKGDALVSLDRYDEAIEVYKQAQASGRDDTNVAWNLGWIYYLQGKYNEAIGTDRHALDLNPDLIGVRMNLALALLASGEYDEAEQEYNNTVARTHELITRAHERGETISADFWYYLEAGVTDLYNLVLTIEGFDTMEGFNFGFIQSPDRDVIANPVDTETEAFGNIVTLRSKIAAFEYYARNGEMPAEITPDASIGAFAFGAIVEDQAEEMSGEATGNIFPSNTKSITAYYDYENIHPGQHVSYKMFINFQNYPEYGYTIDSWAGAEAGPDFFRVNDPYEQFSKIYNMAPGLYTVEMYIDHVFVQTGFFYIMSLQEEEAVLGTP